MNIKNQTHITLSNLASNEPIMTKVLRGTAIMRSNVGGPTVSANKFKRANGGHIECRKMLIYPYWMKV